jgi:predicted aconitase with swiveling domain
MRRRYQARKVVRGQARAPALVCRGSFSFLGDVDLATGEILALDHPHRGETIGGRVLIYEVTRGSSGGCVVLQALARAGRAPAALVTVRPADYNLAEGAILAQVPFVCEPDGDILAEVQTGEMVLVDADAGVVEV